VKRIAVLTSGGDAPGMNAAIRAVVRRGIYNGLEVYGVKHGYAGLMDGNFQEMELGSVGDIIHRGGTILRSARSEFFKTVEGQQQAIASLKEAEINGLIVIGGDGTFQGAKKLSIQGISTIGIPGTIDNDIAGTDYSIGFDTAVNTALDAIDKIRDTAYSHDRICIIEVMGRKAGDIALWAGLCSGAESIIIPEASFCLDDMISRIQSGQARGKTHTIIVLAEGVCKADELNEKIKERLNYEASTMVLGYLQRGGSPTAYDRMMASKMGAKAVDLLINGVKGNMIGWKNGQLVHLPFEIAEEDHHKIDMEDYYLARSLSI
jgi:6-phosphofructokinase 1